MKHKKVKALLSATLVLSLIGGNNLSYVGAKNQQETENAVKIEEQTSNADKSVLDENTEKESEAEEEIQKEENGVMSDTPKK